MRTLLLFILVAICSEGLAGGVDLHRITLPPPTASLKEGGGVYVARRYCSICHSLDYITTQPKFPKARWQAEVAKMIKVYGAPIPEESARVITGYIAACYGTGS